MEHNKSFEDYLVNDDCRRLDSALSEINNQEFEMFMKKMPSGVPLSHEEVLRYCGKNKYDASLTPRRHSRKELFREKLISFLVNLEGKLLTKEEILNLAEKERILSLMRGPFKKFRLWNKIRYIDTPFFGIGGVFLCKREYSLKDYIFLKKNRNYEEEVYEVRRETFLPMD